LPVSEAKPGEKSGVNDAMKPGLGQSGDPVDMKASIIGNEEAGAPERPEGRKRQ
jgi:hypothetical protein